MFHIDESIQVYFILRIQKTTHEKINLLCNDIFNAIIL